MNTNPTPATPPLLAVSNLSRRFGERLAVDAISFAIHAGEAVGLLGPNGAGKSTTLGLLCGLLRPSSGQILINGLPHGPDDDPGKARIGLVPQEIALLEGLSAHENLALCGALYRLQGPRLHAAIQQALDLVGLSDRASERIGAFSGGMKRRLNIAAALLHDPQLLFLDEPTVGVDPQSRNAIFENIQALHRQGKTIVYTTHYMEEVERLCDRVIIMDHGRILADDSLERLRQRAVPGFELVVDLVPPASGSTPGILLPPMPDILSHSQYGTRLQLRVRSIEGALAQLLPELHRLQLRIDQVQTLRPSLESVFLEWTGRSLRD